MSIEHSVKELTFISYLLFSHNSRNICASAPFFQLPYASVSQSWYVRYVSFLSLEVVKETFPDSSAVVDSNPFTIIIHNLNLTLTTGSRCILIGLNGPGNSTLLCILGGRHLTPPDSYVRVLGLN